jgi:hypothetical protein
MGIHVQTGVRVCGQTGVRVCGVDLKHAYRTTSQAGNQ